ncbi:MAG: ankyrin repeat domain-containing protein [Fluviibacter sp.]|jgi:ankyrin repeat protein
MKNVLCGFLLLLNASILWAAPTADDMVIAAKKDDASTIQEGLKAGFDPNYKDRQGNSLLIHAAANVSDAAGLALLNGGADPKLKNRSGDDALNYAAIKGSLPMVKALVAKGVPVTRPQGWQPLTYAVVGKQQAIFNYLMDQGADPNGNNPTQVSALMYAAQEGQEEMVDRLLAAGADPTWTKGGESAVDWALKAQNTDIAAKIMKAQEKVGFGRSVVLNEPEDDEDAPPEK